MKQQTGKAGRTEKKWLPMEMAICMGMDALRISVGLPPRTFKAAEITRWLRIMDRQKHSSERRCAHEV